MGGGQGLAHTQDRTCALPCSLRIIDVDKVAGSPRDGQLDDLELLLYDLSRPANQAFRRVSGRNSRIDGG